MKFSARFVTIASVVVIGVLLLMFSASLYGALCITLGTLVLYLASVPMFTGKPSPSLTGIDDIGKITDLKKYNLCMFIWGITYGSLVILLGISVIVSGKIWWKGSDFLLVSLIWIVAKRVITKKFVSE